MPLLYFFIFPFCCQLLCNRQAGCQFQIKEPLTMFFVYDIAKKLPSLVTVGSPGARLLKNLHHHWHLRKLLRSRQTHERFEDLKRIRRDDLGHGASIKTSCVSHETQSNQGHRVNRLRDGSCHNDTKAREINSVGKTAFPREVDQFHESTHSGHENVIPS